MSCEHVLLGCSKCRTEIDRLRAALQAKTGECERAIAELAAALKRGVDNAREAARLRPVYGAACAWRDEQGSSTPLRYATRHAATETLIAAVDAARAKERGERSVGRCARRGK